MKVAVIGSGGREHALIKSLKKSHLVTKLYCIPGNDAMVNDCQIVPLKATDFDGIENYLRFEGVECVVVGPDDPLVLGIADRLDALHIPCFGPKKSGALLEGSKAYAKHIMHKYSIPTAEYRVFDDEEKAVEYLKNCTFPTVIKADGLALGKGVIIADNYSDATCAVHQMMSEKKFGTSGQTVVIEEYLQGREISMLTLCDGKTILPLCSAMDHKKILDQDKGLNTGGMGAIAPCPFYTEALHDEFMKKIALPTLNAIRQEGIAYNGCLYFGLMHTSQGLKVIEFNCRFGDPETQAVLPLLKNDLFELLLATIEGKLSQCKTEFYPHSSCCVVLSSKGYPESYTTGFPININGEINGEIYYAGVKSLHNCLVTNGGRVLAVTVTGKTLHEAIDKCYGEIGKIDFCGAYHRNDIGAAALK